MNWNVLEELLQTCTRPDWTEAELSYLRIAYDEIEASWEKHKVSLPKIDYIILGEAPLYGAEKKYIYAENGSPSAFLWPTSFPSYHKLQHGSGKAALWKLLAENNMIVLDLFPYALNEQDTKTLTYKDVHRRGYPNFYRSVFLNFTADKISEIRRHNPSVSILVRYKRLFKHVAPLLDEMGFVEGAEFGGYSGIFSKHMGVNKEVFWQFCKSKK